MTWSLSAFFLLGAAAFFFLSVLDVAEPVWDVLLLAVEDLVVGAASVFRSFFFSFSPLPFVEGWGVFFVGLSFVPDFSDFSLSRTDGSAVFCVLSFFSAGRPYILLKVWSSSSEMCLSSLDESSRPTRMPRCTRVPGAMLCRTTCPTPVALTRSPMRSNR